MRIQVAGYGSLFFIDNFYTIHAQKSPRVRPGGFDIFLLFFPTPALPGSGCVGIFSVPKNVNTPKRKLSDTIYSVNIVPEHSKFKVCGLSFPSNHKLKNHKQQTIVILGN
jgi:hypothetical protein